MLFRSAKIRTIEYWYRPEPELTYHKFVTFFLFRYVSDELSPQVSEVDDAQWVPIDEAIRRATYPTERDVLGMARDELARSAPDATAHNAAVPR